MMLTALLMAWWIAAVLFRSIFAAAAAVLPSTAVVAPAVVQLSSAVDVFCFV